MENGGITIPANNHLSQTRLPGHKNDRNPIQLIAFLPFFNRRKAGDINTRKTFPRWFRHHIAVAKSIFDLKIPYLATKAMFFDI